MASAAVSEQDHATPLPRFIRRLDLSSILISFMTTIAISATITVHIHSELSSLLSPTTKQLIVIAVFASYGLAVLLAIAGSFQKRASKCLSVVGIALSPASFLAVTFLFPTLYTAGYALLFPISLEETFEEMNPSTSAIMQFSSAGCSHGDSFQLRFDGSKPGTVGISRSYWDDAGNLRSLAPVSVPLSRDEAGQIDAMRSHFRQPMFVTHTSTDQMSVNINWERGEKQVVEEDIHTNSPGHFKAFNIIVRLIERAGYDFR